MTAIRIGTITLAIGLTLTGAMLFSQTSAPSADGKSAAAVAYRPKVPGKLRLRQRSRIAVPGKKGAASKAMWKYVEWNTSETAIIICDMWDGHYCKSSAQRVDAMAPKMNRVVTAARNHGVMIIHAPSGCMNMYAGTPFRERMTQAKTFKSPVPLQRWCYLEKDREGKLPIDDSKSPCDDPVVGPRVRKYTRQHKAIKISGYDGISDNGQEIYNTLRQLGIKNVVLMGVHTNMCVLGRPFGIRQLVKVGMNVVLVRDLTDTMYDPRAWPYVSHTRGTELVVEHIERHWCPSIDSRDLMKVIAGSNGPNLNVSNSGTK